MFLALFSEYEANVNAYASTESISSIMAIHNWNWKKICKWEISLPSEMASGEKCFKAQIKVQLSKQTCLESITDNSILIILVFNFEVNIFQISSNFVLDMSSPWYGDDKVWNLHS